MTEIGYAALGIIPSFEGFQGKLEKGSAGAFASAGRSGGKHMASGAASSMRSHVKTIVAPLLGAFAAVKVKDFLGDSIAEARDSQKVGALTTSVIKATGKAAHVTAKQVGDLSTALSNKTGIDDETIQSGANMLLTFKNIRNEAGKGNKIFDKSTKTLVDLAAAMGTEPKQAAIQLGKALNDPVKGITALTRVGVTFDDQQKKQIKTMVKHNDTIGAQKIILKELNSEFGGAAAAQATWGDKASVAWSNFKEGIGTSLLPVIDTIEKKFVREGIPELNKFSGWFQKEGIPAIEDFGHKAEPVVKSILPAIGHALGTAKDAAAYIAPKLKSVFDGFNSLPDWVKSTLVIGAGSAAIGKKLGVGKLIGSKGGGLGGGSGLLGMFTKANPVPVLVVNDWGKDGLGLPGKPKGKPKIPGTPLPLAAVPYLTPLLTSGDTAPGQATVGATKSQVKAHHSMQSALAGLYKNLGADKFGFSKSGQGADAVLGGLLTSDTRRGLQYLKQAADTAGVSWNKFATDAMPKTQAAVKRLEGKYGDLGTALAKTSGHVKTLSSDITGLPQSKITRFIAQDLAHQMALVRQYGGMLDGLDGRVIKTFIRTTTTKVVGQLGTTDSGEGAANRPPRFHGGPVAKDRAYIVGERRPELFVPSTNGRIEPRVTAGGGLPSSVTLVVRDGGSFASFVADIAGDEYASRDTYRRTTRGH